VLAAGEVCCVQVGCDVWRVQVECAWCRLGVLGAGGVCLMQVACAWYRWGVLGAGGVCLVVQMGCAGCMGVCCVQVGC
jgi:hypothetical protein